MTNHEIFQDAIEGPYTETSQQIIFGMGCFWGAERLFWQIPGVEMTAVGYSGGSVSDPSYVEVCQQQTGHAEVVLVVFDPEVVTLQQLLQTFWENHDPTQGMRQGNDIGSQYRSVIYVFDDAQLQEVTESKNRYEQMIREKGYGLVTTEISLRTNFYFAEPYHQQYLHKNPGGYCGLKGTGVSCPAL